VKKQLSTKAMKEKLYKWAKNIKIGQKNSREKSFSAIKAISFYRVRDVSTIEDHPKRRLVIPI